MKRLKTTVLLTMLICAPLSVIGDTATEYLIDDFKSPEGRSALGSYWQLSSDRVMGGVSDGRAYMIPSAAADDRYILKMVGEVRLENNGGFIQVRLPLRTERRPFNAAEFQGIALNVRGNGERYYVHFRTTQSRRPWLYYYQAFTAPREWTRIELPFESFIGENTASGGFRTDRLVSVAVVAAKQRMSADIEVSRVSLYR
jgi:hypothetical protein